MTVDGAYELLRCAISRGRVANGYLLVGDVRGDAFELATRILADLFPGHADLGAHPDVHFLAPEKRSRIVSVEAIRSKLIEPLGQTAFAGGWKAGVLLFADRVKDASANAFLKILEEPPPNTLFLLLTDAPEALLPTIVSRCQRVDVGTVRRELAEPWRTRALDLLARDDLSGTIGRMAFGADATVVLGDMQEHARRVVADEVAASDEGPGAEITKDELQALEQSRYRELRADFLKLLAAWFRDLQALALAGKSARLCLEERRAVLEARAARLEPAQAFRNVETVERAEALYAGNMQDGSVMSFLAETLNFGTVAP